MKVVNVAIEYDQKGGSFKASLSNSFRLDPDDNDFVFEAPKRRSGIAMQYVPSMKNPSTLAVQANPSEGRTASKMTVYRIPPIGAPQVVTPTAIDRFLVKERPIKAILGTKSIPSKS